MGFAVGRSSIPHRMHFLFPRIVEEDSVKHIIFMTFREDLAVNLQCRHEKRKVTSCEISSRARAAPGRKSHH